MITGEMLTPELIEKYILHDNARRDALIEDYERYTCEEIPIQNRIISYTDTQGRQIEDKSKINRKINSDFCGYIVNNKANYMCSIPPVLDVRENTSYTDEEKSLISLKIEDFKIRNNWESLCTNTAKLTGATGESAWILSMQNDNGRGEEYVDLINPWEIIEVEKGKCYIRYYISLNFELEYENYVEVYDEKYIYKYKAEKGWSGLTLVEEFPKLHLFNGCPVIRFKNNREVTSDFFNVKEWIDQYDRTSSDLVSELEQLRLAYLVILGAKMPAMDEIIEDDSTGASYSKYNALVDQVKQAGIINLTSMPNSPLPDAKFIEKKADINSTINLLRTIEKNIMRFAGSFDATSDTYTGNLTNMAIDFKISPLDGRAKASISEAKHSIRQAFKVLQSTWNLKEITFNYLDINIEFKVNKPVNVAEEIETIVQKGGGVISQRTLLGTASFIPNVSEEIGRVESESGQKADNVNINELRDSMVDSFKEVIKTEIRTFRSETDSTAKL